MVSADRMYCTQQLKLRLRSSSSDSLLYLAGRSLGRSTRMAPARGARGRRPRVQFFFRSCAGARGENIFEKFSLVRKAGHTDGGGGRCFRLLDRRESSISASFS